MGRTFPEILIAAVDGYVGTVGRTPRAGQGRSQARETKLNPMRRQPSGIKEKKDLWEIHHDPYDVSRIWVRDTEGGGWVTAFWKHLHRAPVPFGELAWDHTVQIPRERLHDLRSAPRTELASGRTDSLGVALQAL